MEGVEVVSTAQGAHSPTLDAASRHPVAAPSRPSGEGPASPTTRPAAPAVGEHEFPPGYVFAPGFMLADRRGLVPYPGLRVAENMRPLLASRSDHVHAQRAYAEASRSYR